MPCRLGGIIRHLTGRRPELVQRSLALCRYTLAGDLVSTGGSGPFTACPVLAISRALASGSGLCLDYRAIASGRTHEPLTGVCRHSLSERRWCALTSLLVFFAQYCINAAPRYPGRPSGRCLWFVLWRDCRRRDPPQVHRRGPSSFSLANKRNCGKRAATENLVGWKKPSIGG